MIHPDGFGPLPALSDRYGPEFVIDMAGMRNHILHIRFAWASGRFDDVFQSFSLRILNS